MVEMTSKIDYYRTVYDTIKSKGFIDRKIDVNDNGTFTTKKGIYKQLDSFKSISSEFGMIFYIDNNYTTQKYIVEINKIKST